MQELRNAPSQSAVEEGSALQDLSVVNNEDLTFGLPSFFFWGGIAATIGIAFLFHSVWWIVTPLFGFIYFTAMYGVHANDPMGARGWVRALRRVFTWSGGRTRGRRVLYLEERE